MRLTELKSKVKKNKLLKNGRGGFILFALLLFASIFISFYTPTFYPFLLRHRLEKIAVFMNPNDSKLFFEIGNSYFGQGKEYDVSKSKQAYLKALKLNPNYLEAHYQLGRIYFIQGAFNSALMEIKEVLRLDPEFEKAYYMYGLINGYMDNLDQAAYGFSEFIKRDDFNWAGYNDLAWIYFKQGDYEKTYEVAKKGLEKAPNNPWLNNIYGTALLNLGQKNEAKIAFETALAVSDTMTPEDWGRSYPGNNPDIYAAGLEETRSVIRHNLSLVSE